MTDMTPLKAVQLMAQTGRDLDHVADELRDADRQAVDAREAFTLAYNKAFVTETGSVEQRKALATIATHTERYAADVADAQVRDWRNRIRILERRIDVLRSTVGVLRVEAEVSR